MVRHHASIPSLMHGIVVVAIPFGILAGFLKHRPIVGLPYCLDTGLMASVATLVALTPSVLRGRSRPFAVGLVIAGWMAVVAYVGSCVTFPDLVNSPICYYLNEIESRFIEADTPPVYAVSLIVIGLILTVPQAVLALSGGLVAMVISRRKTRVVCRPS